MKNHKEEKKSQATVSMYSGELTFMGCPRIDVQGKIPSGALVVWGIPFDTATSNRPGARFGPRSIRIASKMLSWQKLYPWEEDLYGAERTEGTNQSGKMVFDGGDAEFDFGRRESVVSVISEIVSKIIRSGAKPLILGGDHFITFPVLQALYCEQPLALVHFDAHDDMWEDEPGRIDHGTGFFHALKEGIIDRDHSIQIGLRTHREQDRSIAVLDNFETDLLSPSDIAGKIRKQVGDRPCYLTFDIDSLDPCYAPGTGTPVCGGLSTVKVLAVLRELSGINWVGADVVEVSPPYDHAEITALAGATVAANLGHLIMN